MRYTRKQLQADLDVLNHRIALRGIIAIYRVYAGNGVTGIDRVSYDGNRVLATVARNYDRRPLESLYDAAAADALDRALDRIDLMQDDIDRNRADLKVA